MKELRQKIETLIAASTCRGGIVISNQTTGDRLEINPEMVFPAASMIKIPIMYEIMRQAAAGDLSLDQLLVVTQTIHVGGAGILKELRPDITMTIRELVTLMIILSDNTATNMLIDLVGMAAINKTMADLGLKSTVLRRQMMDFDAAQSGRENETTASDLSLLLEIIYSNRLLSQEYGTLMLDILMRQQVKDKIPFFLPEDTVIAHKTGTLPGAEHDGGILFVPGGPYIICILTNELKANYQGLQLVATLGKVIYEHLTNETE